MNELIPIFEVDGVPVTTSRAVAEQFGKRHDNVIQAIENILNSKSEKVNVFTALNFKVSEYTDISGKTNKQYLMTRDGFALLAMGFTGEKALEFKVAYINAFNRMEELIRGGRATNKQLESTFSSLAAIDTTAEQGKADIVALTVAETLAALSSAVNNGAYSLYRKNRPDNRTGEGELIGVYDEFCVIVRSTSLYSLYAADKKNTLTYYAWKEYLKSGGYRFVKNKRLGHGFIIPIKQVNGIATL